MRKDIREWRNAEVVEELDARCPLSGFLRGMGFEWMYKERKESRGGNIIRNFFNKHHQKVGLVVSILKSTHVDTWCAGD